MRIEIFCSQPERPQFECGNLCRNYSTMSLFVKVSQDEQLRQTRSPCPSIAFNVIVVYVDRISVHFFFGRQTIPLNFPLGHAMTNAATIYLARLAYDLKSPAWDFGPRRNTNYGHSPCNSSFYKHLQLDPVVTVYFVEGRTAESREIVPWVVIDHNTAFQAQSYIDISPQMNYFLEVEKEITIFIKMFTYLYSWFDVHKEG